MSVALPDHLTVLLISPTQQQTLDQIEAVMPGRVRALGIWEDIQPELAEDWPPETISRRVGNVAPPTRSRDELEQLLQEAHVVVLGVPYPLRAAARMSNLLWCHLPFAGVTNLRDTAWWDEKLILTSARGSTSALPIAESAMAGAFMLARRLDLAVLQSAAAKLDANAYNGTMSVLNGKTMGIIGLGGIGSQVARLARGCGMRVIASRHSAHERQLDVDGVDVLFPASETLAMLAESDFVAVCSMWTPETEKMLNAEAFAAMKPGACLLNVARGEIVDEPAMVAALHSGRLAGAYIDVWQDDVSSPPIPELLSAPNLIITPHVSPGSDANFRDGLRIFLENLRRLFDGEELINQVDWQRGY